MRYITQIRNFLNDPQNIILLEKYQESIEEFQLQFIIPKQREFEYFDDVFNDLVTYLINKDYLFKTNKRLTRMMVFYMYWNCDIGTSNDDSSK